MAIARILLALILGFVLGVGAMIYVVYSGATDLVVRRSPVVEDLERNLRDAEKQRDQLGRQLADVESRFGRSEKLIEDLERRFRDLEKGGAAGRAAEAPRTPEPPRPADPAAP